MDTSPQCMTQREFITQILPLKDKIYRFALSRMYDRAAAEDVVQEVYVKLWQQRERLAKVENQEAWCIRCTRNLIIDFARARRPKSSLEVVKDIESGQMSDDGALHADLMLQVRAVLEKLPERQREIFRLRDLVGYSNQEIEEILDMNTTDVRVNLCRARKKVRQLLKEKLYNGVTQQIQSL